MREWMLVDVAALREVVNDMATTRTIAARIYAAVGLTAEGVPLPWRPSSPESTQDLIEDAKRWLGAIEEDGTQ